MTTTAIALLAFYMAISIADVLTTKQAAAPGTASGTIAVTGRDCGLALL